MATYKDIVDRISNTYKTLSKDDRVSKRYILSVLKSKIEYLIAQKLNDKSLFREDGLYTEIRCFELEKQDVFECDVVEFRSCHSVMKSTKKLPDIINSRFGPAVKSVTNIDNSNEYKPVTLNQYRRNKLRVEKDPFQRYYIKNGYLYLPDSNISVVNVEILTLENYFVDSLSACSTNICQSYWDYNLISSDKITEIAIQETMKELGINKQIELDENPNLNSIQKDSTVA